MFFILLIKVIQALEFSPENIVVAINCGGLKIHYRNVYLQEDTYFSSGSRALVNELSIEQMAYMEHYDFKVYNFCRISDETFSYKLPLSRGPGTYEIALLFIEAFFTQKRKRMFNVRLGDCIVEDHLDIYARTGIYPFTLIFQFQFTEDERIILNDTICYNAYKFRSNSIVVEFERIYGFDAPKVEAIILFYGTDNGLNDDVVAPPSEEEQIQEVIDTDGRFLTLTDVFFSLKGLILFCLVFGVITCIICYDETQEEIVKSLNYLQVRGIKADFGSGVYLVDQSGGKVEKKKKA